MTIILFILLIFILLTSKYKKENTNYLSKDYTNIIKGIFIFFVFIRHFVGYKLPFSSSWIDLVGLKIDSKLGQLIVTMFLFYSGYGIIESYKKKKKEYVKNLPKKRILSTLINFDVAVIIYTLVATLFMNVNFSLKKFSLALIGLDTYGNSNWYIFCILILYLITFLSLTLFKDKKKYLLSMTLGTILYMVIMSNFTYKYWYATSLCFVLGAIYSSYKDEIEKLIKGKEYIILICSIITFLISYKFSKNIIVYNIFIFAFICIILMLSRKIDIKNNFLKWMGQNLFPLYIFQRLPMLVLNKIDYFHNNYYIFFIVSFVITILITLLYNWIQKLISKLTSKNKKELAN